MDRKKVVESFQPYKFEPSYWYTNNHWQTIIGSGAISGKIHGFVDRPFGTTFERISTHDGDYFDIEFSNNVEQTESIVLILHGLESDRRSHTVTKYANAMLEKGFSVCLISFRACNGEDNLWVWFHIFYFHGHSFSLLITPQDASLVPSGLYRGYAPPDQAGARALATQKAVSLWVLSGCQCDP